MSYTEFMDRFCNDGLSVQYGKVGHRHKLLWRGVVISMVPDDAYIMCNPGWAQRLLADYRRSRRRLSLNRATLILSRALADAAASARLRRAVIPPIRMAAAYAPGGAPARSSF